MSALAPLLRAAVPGENCSITMRRDAAVCATDLNAADRTVCRNRKNFPAPYLNFRDKKETKKFGSGLSH